MRKGVIGLVVLFSISLFPAHSATPPKAGSVCSKQGLTKTYQGKKYTCIKSGKKLVWSKGVIIKSPSPTPTPTPSPSPTPTPTPTSTPTPTPTPSPYPTPSSTKASDVRQKQKTSPVSYIPPSTPGTNVDQCKIREVSKFAGSSGARSGFPRLEPPIYSNSGTIKWALVPIDFIDIPGESDFLDRVQLQMDLASEWIDMTSEGKVKLVWQIQKDWIRVPGISKDYEVPFSGTPQRPEIARIWNIFMSESDKVVNFQDVQAVHFILPKGQNIFGEAAKGYAWDTAVKEFTTNEGSKIGFFTIPGVFYDRSDLGRVYWSYWVKEYARGLGAGAIGAQRVESSFQTFDIQGNTDGERELTGWFRFLLGWLPDKNIYCQPASGISNVEITLIPLPEKSIDRIKLVVIPLSESKAIIVESRRETKFACLTPTQRNGVLVYLYDGRFGSTEEFFSAISPNDRKIERYDCATTPSIDPLLHEGDSVTFEGVKIELLLHGSFDRIRISR